MKSEFIKITFQNGPVQEAGVNGVFMEDVIDVLVDRLQNYQAGAFACKEKPGYG